MLTADCIEPELIKVTLEQDGFSASCYVTSHHLVPDKERQLRAAILREAMAVLEPTGT